MQLRRHVRGRGDSDVWIDEKEGENFSVVGFSEVGELKGH